MANRPSWPHGPFPGKDMLGRRQSIPNIQNTGQSFLSPSSQLTPGFSSPSSGTPMPQRSGSTPASQQQAYNLGRDELMARFLGWEMTQNVRGVLSDREKRNKYVSNNWFNMCESLEKEYASKNEACRNKNYDEVWCPMKLENYYNFIKQETRRSYPEEFATIAWNKKMDPHIKTIMISQMAHRGSSLLECIKILKNSLGPPQPQIDPQMTTPSYASSGQPSIWGPPDCIPYTPSGGQNNVNPWPQQKKWPK